jgi:hypothetical protein
MVAACDLLAVRRIAQHGIMKLSPAVEHGVLGFGQHEPGVRPVPRVGER